MAWVYILKCADGSYYTGMTRGEEPDQRLSEHRDWDSIQVLSKRRGGKPATPFEARYATTSE